MCSYFRLGKSDTMTTVEKILPSLLHKSGDTVSGVTNLIIISKSQ